MKNLLAVLGTAVLGSTVVSPLINQNQNIKLQQTREVYWNSNHQEVEFFTEWSSSKINYFRLEANLGRVDMANYKWISVIDPNNASYTRSSWANTPYHGRPFGEIQRREFDILLWERETKTDAEIFSYSNIILLMAGDWSGWATFHSDQNVGMSYYSKNGDTYLQLFGYQAVDVEYNASGGAMWLNLGQGIRLESD